MHIEVINTTEMYMNLLKQTIHFSSELMNCVYVTHCSKLKKYYYFYALLIFYLCITHEYEQ